MSEPTGAEAGIQSLMNGNLTNDVPLKVAVGSFFLHLITNGDELNFNKSKILLKSKNPLSALDPFLQASHWQLENYCKEVVRLENEKLAASSEITQNVNNHTTNIAHDIKRDIIEIKNDFSLNKQIMVSAISGVAVSLFVIVASLVMGITTSKYVSNPPVSNTQQQQVPPAAAR